MGSGGKINQLGEQYIGMVAANVSPGYQPGVVHGGSGSSGTNGGRIVILSQFELYISLLLTTLVMTGATLV